MAHCVVSLSGGMDSSTLLLRAIEKYDTVTGISFDYGQKHRVELERAQSLIDYLGSKGHKVNYRQIKLDGLVDLLDSALVSGGDDVPEGHYEQDNMKETVVPNRNKMFASITIHAGDHAVYPDCRQEFRDADDAAFRIGNWDADRVGYFTPYLDTDKFGILQDGEKLCEILGIDFDEVYKRTNTSYKPYPSGNSDYKSASSVERIEAFIALGRKDPVQYEDETGEVDYEVAKEAVLKVLNDHNTATIKGRD
jgi:7-cyano-7-deazaguanine synthase